MNLAIVHYHLNRGGVARVVENQLRALDAVLDPAARLQVALLHGGRKEGWNDRLAEELRAVDLRLVEVAGLDYESDDEGRADGRSPLAEDLLDALRRLGFAPDETVVHVHNHSLGKNAALTASVRDLAESDFALLLQIHDFAEDFRPTNYRRLAGLGDDRLYPQAPAIHYAVLNGRDHSVLRAAGVDADRLHLLPNPVPAMGQLPDRTDARKKLQAKFDVDPNQRFLLYPVRGIRRKNLGEMLLAGLLSPPGTVVGLTLATLNPAELPGYAMWKETAAAWNLPCRFEVGEPGALTFAENLAASDVLLTTSLAEGFGMVMLESWLARRMLVGRNLPEITVDFADAGLRLDGLWNRLAVPVEWVGRKRFLDRIGDAYREVAAAFDHPLPPDWEQILSEKIDENNTVDFGDLDESMQSDVLGVVVDSQGGRQTLFDGNPRLETSLAVDTAASAATIEHNVRVVEADYSLAAGGRRLLELLRCVAASPRGGPLARPTHPGRILDELLHPRRFRMIR